MPFQEDMPYALNFPANEVGVHEKSSLRTLETIWPIVKLHGPWWSGGPTPYRFNNFTHFLRCVQVQSIIGVIVSTCIQYFYAVRVFRLSQRLGRNIYVPLVICLISTAEFGFTVVFVAKSFEAGSFAKNDGSVPFGTSVLAPEVICGLVITTSMVYYILQQRTVKKNGANHVLNLVILYVVNSGGLILFFAITCLITYASYPNTLIYAPFFFILVRLYPCSFMTILNSRVHIRSRLRRGGENTTITITQEQVIDGDPLATSRLHINPNGDVLAMMTMSKQKRPGAVERVVGFDESTTV